MNYLINKNKNIEHLHIKYINFESNLLKDWSKSKHEESTKKQTAKLFKMYN